MCQACLWNIFWKNLSWKAPLRCRSMFWSVSLEGRINSNKILKNLKPWKPSYVCATYQVCKIIGDLEKVGKITLKHEGLISLKLVFVENVIFSTTYKSPKCIQQHPPKVQTDVLISQSRGQNESNKILKNLKPWKPIYVCATYQVCNIIGDLEKVEKITLKHEGPFGHLSQFL